MSLSEGCEAMKVKLLRVTGHCVGSYDEYEESLAFAITDWEEISEEDYKLLVAWVHSTGNQYNHTTHGFERYILVKQELSIIDSLEKAKWAANKFKKQKEAEAKKIAKSLVERNAKKEAKKAEKEKKKLAELKAKYEQC